MSVDSGKIAAIDFVSEASGLGAPAKHPVSPAGSPIDWGFCSDLVSGGWE